jgi:hypothetical protein
MRLSTSAWWRVITWAFMGLILVQTFGPAIGRIEGNIWPVVRGTQITEVDDDGVTSVFFGVSEKVRDCSFERIEWFIGDPLGGMRSPVQVIFLDRDKLRPAAPFEFGPWGVRLSEETLREGSFAEVYHDCHPLFPTVTRFYP